MTLPAESDLTTALDELNAAFSERAKHWNDQFNQVWDKQLSSLNDAMTVATTTALPTRLDALHERLNDLCVRYCAMNESQRAEFRKSVASRKHVRWGFREHASWVARHIQSPEDVEWVRAGLAATSIEDAQIDFRDTFMNLGELYIAAHEHGVNPLPYFKEVARLSSSNPTAWKAWRSTQYVLEHFEETAFFRADVQHHLQRP